jgi:uncharacterized protein YeaO (DUF488 family)
MIKLKRAYEKPARDDGVRILVDRLWPRGLSKRDAHIDLWLKEAGPSTELRKWFGHDPSRWSEFRQRYFRELKAHPEEIRQLLDRSRGGPVTLVFGSKEEKYNNAVALKAYLESHGRR